ncbi:MAG TPA: 4-deoxy-4-formamido-L-arabinose-phosphoundecaprenol deformylase [Desulfocapsa sulfexigens]|nr:4-deoxy-4-formamido-L-arabinose-phosphoundecaprenol deformylase [Desulfocapsa sulfexigens]
MCAKQITTGLRVDVDTQRGTRLGVPNLLTIFAYYNIRATFFFSVGPDNMGRHLWRLFRPAFLLKMVRTGAPSLYGWDILFKGTFWPGPVIGKTAAEQIRATAEAGHETGLHAWDHHQWQNRIKTMNKHTVKTTNDRAMDLLGKIVNKKVRCMAAPSWKMTSEAIHDREQRDLSYCSDCRGRSVFHPMIHGKIGKVVQIPTTLPTFDELIGRKGITCSNYNKHLLGHFRHDQLNVLTIHAEAEGGACFELFREFLQKAQKKDIQFCNLESLLQNNSESDVSTIVQGKVTGREGWVSCQGERHEQ